MDPSSELFFQADFVAPYAVRTRRFSLAIIVLSCLCVFNSAYNSLTSTGLSLYASILFLLTSLAGVLVGGVGFHAFKTSSSEAATRYLWAAAIYAVVYVVNIVICSILEVMNYLESDDTTVVVVLVSSILACSVLGAAVFCVLNVITAYNFNLTVPEISHESRSTQSLLNEKLGYSSLHPIRTPSTVQEIQLRNTGGNFA
jgi:hypothetical protein